MDTLALELEKLANASNAPVLEPYVRKLTDSRKRIGNINGTLHNIQDRLDRMQASVSEVIKARRSSIGQRPDDAPDAAEAAPAAPSDAAEPATEPATTDSADAEPASVDADSTAIEPGADDVAQ
ncbi:uncharacterized protein AMSG_03318 [Thecamonas trahens ATCC 50062]|uniref:Biogenesis of lysosome-related organelles complex 1 subunit 7 n=1 Tax=Thecamonas trahens ATCC 50062 TaxID=461836 RepID=A0A0L0D3H9_THETB|nr:hypothetical protein AMSG_03318 [Thecamonas trahens ATCC 50062]KNC46887.1 hypothetical protein AMSG_03318 [Thecamonas trahens ATCC 50062]|eukprot:XP_013760160.1 hypothetical protein AMSG_03318 [Thecamonas trahens ATCC 50062]